MSDEQLPADRDEEGASGHEREALPDPNGRPQAITIPRSELTLGGVIAYTAFAGLAGGFLLNFMTPTMGGTRSARLRTLELQRDIDEAILAEEQQCGERPLSTPTPESKAANTSIPPSAAEESP